MINKITLGPLNGYEISVDKARMQIISDFGCNINFLTLDNKEVLDTNTKVDDLINDVLCKSDLLAPFPNRISAGQYAFENVTYQLEHLHFSIKKNNNLLAKY
jgi:galactose mutarotase-like enzyme